MFDSDQMISLIVALFIVFVVLLLPSWHIVRSIFPKVSRTGDDTLDELIDKAGYSYDPEQDIFYSKMNAWQRKFGYCRLYDEAAAPSGMILDCEPITFEYDGKRWLIQLWKGQYYMNTGCEIGVYIARQPDLMIPGVFDGTFYKAVSGKDRLFLFYSLMKNGKELFRRGEKHWWLTGFKLGEFSEPDELSMNIRIVFKDGQMCDAFVKALQDVGYRKYEIMRNGFTVGFRFWHTHTPQPLTRTEDTDWIIQRNNERLCERYQEITAQYDTWPEKLKALQEQEPFLYRAVLTIGKTGHNFKAFEKLKQYLF
jgi:hypothetical protein